VARNPRAAAPPQPHPMLQWPSSKVIGRTSEIAVMTPIRLGCVAGERRTYEERAVAVIGNLAAQHESGLPTVLSAIPAIHFGRVIVIRPEQYLLDSEVPGVDYYPKTAFDQSGNALGPAGGVPRPIDDYVEKTASGGAKPSLPFKLRSFLVTLVEFDGDLKVYFRDIAVFLARSFDLIFENCEEYPGTADFERFWLWIRRYQINTQLFYATYGGLSVVRIKQLESFKRRFDAFVARVRSPTGERVGSMDELFDDFLRENQQIADDFPARGGTYGPYGVDEGG
jgi:hypothetical protein